MWKRPPELLHGRAVLAATLLSAAGASAAALAIFSGASKVDPPRVVPEPAEPALSPAAMIDFQVPLPPAGKPVARQRTRLKLPSAVGPGAAARWIRAGNWYASRGLFKPALSSFQRAIAADLHSADAWYAIALCDDALHRNRSAGAAVAQALAVDPWHPMANLLAGVFDQDKGDVASARRHYERYLAKDSVGPYAKEVTLVLQQLPAPH